jgi:hypothetical protein
VSHDFLPLLLWTKPKNRASPNRSSN